MILLDTHVLSWVLIAPDKLSKPARAAHDATSSRFVSAASLYEMSFKASLGKWPDVDHLVEKDLTRELGTLGIEVLPATGQIMQLAGRLEWTHRDPFDRLIVASAIVHGLDLISADGTLDSCPDQSWSRVW